MCASRHPHSPHRTQQLAARARAMKWAPPPTELALWHALRAGQLGVQFRRQVVVGEHIADFLAAEVRLIVEVDGGWHRGRERADARRQRALERAGYRVLRFTAAEVVAELPRVVAVIRAVVRGAGG